MLAAPKLGRLAGEQKDFQMSAEKPEPDPAETAQAAEETKRKFREALERKKAQSHGTGADHRDGASSIHAAHGPASHQREFRRKSG